MQNFLKAAIKTPIIFYRVLVSPMFGPKCRFHPTCSAYAMEAIDRYGIIKGFLLGTRRLLNCHPWHHGNFTDPVPEAFAWRSLIRYKHAQENLKTRKTS